jgi:hypothetical protein
MRSNAGMAKKLEDVDLRKAQRKSPPPGQHFGLAVLGSCALYGAGSRDAVTGRDRRERERVRCCAV